MNILFLAQRVPYPPNKGDKLRSFNEIKYLSRNHRISLVCLADSSCDLQHTGELKKYCNSVEIVFHSPLKARLHSLIGLCSSRPLTLAHFHSNKLQKIVDRKLREEHYDLIFVYCSSMAQYVEQVRHIPRVIDYVDVDSEKWAQYSSYSRFPMTMVYGIESRRLRLYERAIASQYQHGFFVSERECDDFKRLVTPTAAITAILNGVDLDTFKPASETFDPDTIVFTGAMDYFANVDAVLYFTKAILPLIRQRIPTAKFLIVGSNPTEELKRLAANCPHITVTGFVECVQPYVHSAAAFVAPMRIARGVQNKILEAMAMGVPVVTTPIGFEGIAATPGRDLYVEDEAEQFAQRVINLMQNNTLRSEMSMNARRVVENRYMWSTNLETLDVILGRVRGDIT